MAESGESRLNTLEAVDSRPLSLLIGWVASDAPDSNSIVLLEVRVGFLDFNFIPSYAEILCSAMSEACESTKTRTLRCSFLQCCRVQLVSPIRVLSQSKQGIQHLSSNSRGVGSFRWTRICKSVLYRGKPMNIWQTSRNKPTPDKCEIAKPTEEQVWHPLSHSKKPQQTPGVAETMKWVVNLSSRQHTPSKTLILKKVPILL